MKARTLLQVLVQELEWTYDEFRRAYEKAAGEVAADAGVSSTTATVEEHRSPRVLRRALYSWAFNKKAWNSDPQEEWVAALDWLERHSNTGQRARGARRTAPRA